MSVPVQLVLAYALGLLLLYAIGWLLLVPFRFLSKLLLNGVFGGMLLVIVHLLSGLLHLSIGLNPLTALISALLGVPGVGLLLLLPALTGF